MVHLKYLEEEGRVERDMQEQWIVFFTEVSDV
jgi:hypothetical protein